MIRYWRPYLLRDEEKIRRLSNPKNCGAVPSTRVSWREGRVCMCVCVYVYMCVSETLT
jgi:hypothetical protein